MLDKADLSADEIIASLAEGHPCDHPMVFTASGVGVCIDEACIYAHADCWLVEDYPTAAPTDLEDVA